jgi:hypothetical protein
VDLHASTHFVGGTDSLASEYANIGDLTGGAYTLPMSSVEPGVTNAIIVTLPSGTLDSILNGGANTVLRGGTTGGGLTGMSFGSVTDSHFGGQLLLAHGGTGLSSFTAGDTLYYAAGLRSRSCRSVPRARSTPRRAVRRSGSRRSRRRSSTRRPRTWTPATSSPARRRAFPRRQRRRY